MQILSISDATPYHRETFRPVPVEQLFTEEPSISTMHAFSQRESTLGVGTISAQGMMILHNVITALQIPWSILRHTPSLTAYDKQIILAQHATSLLVNKTLSVHVGNKLALITGVGDFALQRGQITELGKLLGLSSHQRKRIEINPRWFSPEEHLHLKVGMVSPFFIHTPGVDAVALLPISEQAQTHVAISLSLEESLVVPTNVFHRFVLGFAQHAYPALPVISLTNTHEAIHMA